MTIEPILGIQKQDKIISEREFEFFHIFSTKALLENYFKNYGYHFVGFYAENPEYLVVRNHNYELEVLVGNPNLYRVIEYRTGELIKDNLSMNEVVNNKFSDRNVSLTPYLKYRIEGDNPVQLIEKANSQVLITADWIRFLSNTIFLYSICGLEYIYDETTHTSYPLMKKESQIYVGKEEDFVDLRKAMFFYYNNTIQLLSLDCVNLLELVREYPYSEQLGNRMRLLSLPLKYGVFYQHGSMSEIKWFDKEEEQRLLFQEIKQHMEMVFHPETEKQKTIGTTPKIDTEL